MRRLNPFLVLRNQRGVALLVAIFAIMLMIFIATEVSYDTSVEFIVARQQVNRLKAYYAARAGIEISLLRILIFKKAAATLGDAAGDKASEFLPMLDPLWQMPFAWPPVLPDNIDGVDKSNIEELVKNSTLDSQYLATIESEGGKIDINDLGSASKQMKENTKQQLIKIFAQENENNEEFRQKYRDTKFEELVNNMIDWIDEDQVSLNGGDEREKYGDPRSDFRPPNAPFKTLKELNMVADMNEDFYKLLINRVTLFGTKGVNVNYAPKEVIASLDPAIKDDVLDKILKRRSDPNEGGPFKNEEDFFKFVGGLGVNAQNIQKAGIPLLFGAEYNFRIKSTGSFGNVTREITAITFDYENMQERYLGILDKEAQDAKGAAGGSGASGAGSAGGANPGTGGTPPTEPAAAEKKKIIAPKGRPTVVYWEES